MSAALSPAPRSLRAVTRETPPPDDVLDALGPDGVAWLHDGAAFVTAGVAATVPASAAVAFLAAIDHDDDPALPGAGPRAFGALGFEPTSAPSLVVPARIVGRTGDGRGWVTDLDVAAPPPAPAGPEPTRFVVTTRTSRDQWRAALGVALAAIDRGALHKVVLARTVGVDADADFDRGAVLRRLRAQQPGCFVHAAGPLVGASPELLVARHGDTVVSRPLAGTTRAGLDALSTLQGSAKDAREHQLVVEAIVAALEPWCEHLDAASRPEVDTFADVAHLATPIYGTLRAPGPGAEISDALALARLLHPTPAVAGTPRPAALAAIAELETEPRGRYAGPVGWVDGRGDGEWAIALRGAAVTGSGALLHAGAGIVAGSDPETEWAETEAKLEPMLRALVRP